MAIYLGNQTISDLERRTGYVFSDEDRKWLESHRQDKADIDYNSDKFHIFDLPFGIHVSHKISDYLVKLLTKYEEIQPSKEQLQIAIVKETDEQREKRLEKERKEKEWQDTLHNPNAVWNIKWYMLVPVNVIDIETRQESECYYGCFINTYTTGRDNISDIINGYASIMMDEKGLHGDFFLDDEEKDNDANKHSDWNYVIGLGFYRKDGSYIGRVDNITFEKVPFSIQDGINNWKNIHSGSYREIHFDFIKEV